MEDNIVVQATFPSTSRLNVSTVSRVEFYIDGGKVWREGLSPYYLGGDSSGRPNGYSIEALSSGAHILRVVVTATDNTTSSIQLTFFRR